MVLKQLINIVIFIYAGRPAGCKYPQACVNCGVGLEPEPGVHQDVTCTVPRSSHMGMPHFHKNTGARKRQGLRRMSAAAFACTVLVVCSIIAHVPVRLYPCVQWMAIRLVGSRQMNVNPIQNTSLTASGLGTEPRPRMAT